MQLVRFREMRLTVAFLHSLLSVLCLHPAEGNSFNFLVLHPLYSGSHELQLRHLSNGLVAKGHRVTYLKFKNFLELPPPDHENITFITLAVDNSQGSVPLITREKEGRFLMPLEHCWKYGLNPWGMPVDGFLTTPPFCNTLLGDKTLRRRLLQSKFDVAIVDLFTNECGLALAHNLGLPTVAFWSMAFNGCELPFSGVPTPTGALPSFMSGHSDRMTFSQRAVNLFYHLVTDLMMRLHFLMTDWVVLRHLPGTPSSQTLIANLSGILANNDFSLDFSREYPPNVVNIGCMQCRHPRPLPKHLEEFMNASGEHGVVYFSLGSTFDATVAPELLLTVLAAFSRIPQSVLMKISGELPKNISIPENVQIERWLPQQDILGHPKTRLYFTHAGMNSALETIWHGVPAVTLPIWADQVDVSSLLVHRGVAIRVFKDSSVNDILAAFSTVLGNRRFSRQAEHLQRIIRNQINSPMDRATWFLELVAATKGAEHLKSGSRTLNHAQKYNLDVMVAALVVIIGLIMFCKSLIRIFRQQSIWIIFPYSSHKKLD